MKKLFVLILALMMSCASLAEGIDFSSMTNEELQALIDGATAEMNSRSEATNNIVDLSIGGTVLDWNGITVTFDGGYEINQYANHGAPENYIDVFGVVDNGSDLPIDIWAGDIAINGWAISCAINDMDWLGSDVEPHRKVKMRFTFDMYEAGVKNVDEITDFSVTFKVFSTETYPEIYESSPVKLIP